MLYVKFETMEHEETTILSEKSTILDGRRCRRRRGNVELKPPQPPVGVGARLGAELGKIFGIWMSQLI